MTSQRIVYTRPDGGVNVICPSHHLSADEVRQHVPPDATNVHVCEVTDLPPSRRFRDAWRQAGAAPPHVDLALARQRRVEELRAERVARLTALDYAINTAEDADDIPRAKVLRVQRRRLRDLPVTEQARLDALTTPEDLDRYAPTWPEDPA